MAKAAPSRVRARAGARASSSGVTAMGGEDGAAGGLGDEDDEAEGGAGGFRGRALREVAGQRREAGGDGTGGEGRARGREGAGAVAAAGVEAL